MTPTQREKIAEVIGHLWTLEESAGTETMSGNYAEQLTDMLAVDKPEEVKPPRSGAGGSRRRMVHRVLGQPAAVHLGGSGKRFLREGGVKHGINRHGNMGHYCTDIGR